MASNIDRQIMNHLEARIKTLAWVKLVEWRKVRIGVSDFRDHEIPLVQFFDGGQQMQHEQGRVRVTWQIPVELVLKSSTANVVDADDLLDRRQELEECLGAQETHLGVQGLVHVHYVSNDTDHFSVRPYFITRLNFEVVYYKPFVRPC